MIRRTKKVPSIRDPAKISLDCRLPFSTVESVRAERNDGYVAAAGFYANEMETFRAYCRLLDNQIQNGYRLSVITQLA